MLYLKYRPQTIAELDNERIKQTLGKALLENQWTHAYLLIGTRGSGKTTTARLIAKIVNCTNRKRGEEPCNKCDSCIAITEARSLDVIEIDAASNTGVEDIRELRERVKLAPASSKYKVYIIDEVHMLSNSAFNALLKTLEEPPENVIFILATTDPQKLPATIVSRCLVYDFGKASKEEIVSSLERKAKEEKLEISKEALGEIAKRADGSFRDADKLLEQLALSGKKVGAAEVEKLLRLETRQRLPDFVGALSAKDAAGSVKIVEEIASAGMDVRAFTVETIGYLRNILLLRAGIDSDVRDVPSLTSEEAAKLTRSLTESLALIKDSPVVQLPLELVIFEHCNEVDLAKSGIVGGELAASKAGKPNNAAQHASSPFSEVESKWPEVLEGVKPLNHSLLALLRAAKPKSIVGDVLTIEVFYKFHKDKLAEVKNRETLEKVVSGIIGVDVQVKFVLTEGK